MFFEQESPKSQFNPKHLMSKGNGIFHLLANDSKFVLILEERNEAGNSILASEVRIKHTPLTYQSDMLIAPKEYNKLSDIKSCIEGLECRYSHDIAKEGLQGMRKIIQTKLDIYDLINPSREEYLNQLFVANKDELVADIFQKNNRELVDTASRQSATSCVIS